MDFSRVRQKSDRKGDQRSSGLFICRASMGNNLVKTPKETIGLELGGGLAYNNANLARLLNNLNLETGWQTGPCGPTKHVTCCCHCCLL